MKNTILIFFLFTGAALSANAQSQALEGLVEKMVKPYLEEEGAHGLTIGIIESGHTYYYSFGQTSEDDLALPDTEALIPIGSSSKIFTAAILMQLVSEEKLSLADPISDILPHEFSNPTVRKLNAHLLASQQSGLPMRPQNYHLKNKDPLAPFVHYTDELSFEYLETYRESKKNYPIGKFRFSNYSYVALGEVICASGQQTWPELFKQYINTNYEITGVSADRPGGEEKLLPIHSITGKEIAPFEYGVFAPSIGVYANLAGSLKFMQVWIDAVGSSEWTEIQESLMEHTETDRKHVKAGYGWFIYPRSKKIPPLYMISGKTNGSWSFYGMVPETKTAVVILSNSRYSVDDIGIEILDVINR